MIDYAELAANATVAADQALPSTTSTRRTAEPNPFLALVKAATKDGKRYDLPGRFSLKPYTGRKNACDAYSVMNKLHAAARQLGVKVQVRKLDPSTDDTGLTFKVSK